MIKGFALDDERLKGNGGGNYWKELLDRIGDLIKWDNGNGEICDTCGYKKQ
jgi:hypothetical protein